MNQQGSCRSCLSSLWPITEQDQECAATRGFFSPFTCHGIILKVCVFCLLFISALCLFSRLLHPSPVFCLLSSLVKSLFSPVSLRVHLFCFALPFLLVPVPSSRRVFQAFGFHALFLAFTLFCWLLGFPVLLSAICRYIFGFRISGI